MMEWKAFKSPNFNVVKSSLKQHAIFDGCNLFKPRGIKAQEIEYNGIDQA